MLFFWTLSVKPQKSDNRHGTPPVVAPVAREDKVAQRRKTILGLRDHVVECGVVRVGLDTRELREDPAVRAVRVVEPLTSSRGVGTAPADAVPLEPRPHDTRFAVVAWDPEASRANGRLGWRVGIDRDAATWGGFFHGSGKGSPAPGGRTTQMGCRRFVGLLGRRY